MSAQLALCAQVSPRHPGGLRIQTEDSRPPCPRGCGCRRAEQGGRWQRAGEAGVCVGQGWARVGGSAQLWCVSALVCVVGNALVIFVILRYAKVKTATNIYLLNLAVADELFMLSVPFVASSATLHHWPFGPALCRAVLSVDGLNSFPSVFCLAVLSVDRYLAGVRPLRAATCRRPGVARLTIAAFASTRPARGGRAVACDLHWPHPVWSAVFVVCTFLPGFLLPVPAVGPCYVLIVGKMWALALPAGWQRRKHSEKKVAWLVLAVAAVFVLCWLPFYAVQLLNLSVTGLDAPVHHVSLIHSHANSCAHPVLYGFLCDDFRRSFQRALCLRCCLLDASGGADQEPLDSSPPPSRAEGTRESHAPHSPASRSPGTCFPQSSCTPKSIRAPQASPLPRILAFRRMLPWG
uniref:Somatostatin receptor 4 n=1 Tax=Monodon monoceros TaxID=40151 RepID=A0A8C6BTN9_MONMO